MRSRYGLEGGVVVLGMLCLACSTSPLPLEHNTLTPDERAAGWQLLFDGKTMNGWNDPARKTPPGDSWIVEDGCLKAVTKPRIREDLLTTETFGDFELQFDWRIAPGGNSGVKYRIQDRLFLQESKRNPDVGRFENWVDFELRNRFGDRGALDPKETGEEYVIGFEFQLIDNLGRDDAGGKPRYPAGSLHGLVRPTTDTTRPAGEFNHSRIVLRDNHVQHWLNGKKVVDAMLDSERVREGLAQRWSTNSPVYELLVKQPNQHTPIGLQHHNDNAWFRNLKIHRL